MMGKYPRKHTLLKTAKSKINVNVQEQEHTVDGQRFLKVFFFQNNWFFHSNHIILFSVFFFGKNKKM